MREVGKNIHGKFGEGIKQNKFDAKIDIEKDVSRKISDPLFNLFIKYGFSVIGAYVLIDTVRRKTNRRKQSGDHR